MFKRFPLLSRFVIFLIIPLAAYGLWQLQQLNNSLPVTKGELALPGITDKVKIVRDSHSVPSITASTDSDAFFAVGYLHAQDRMWQLELQSRVINGTLSEIFGTKSVQQDVLMRTLNFSQSSKASFEQLPEGQKASLQAYADGINQWISEQHNLPMEFALLDIRPSQWQPEYSIALIKTLALGLAGNFAQELRRVAALKSLEEDRLVDVFPEYQQASDMEIAHVGKQSIAQLLDLHQSLQDDLQIGGKYVGSNAWVVAGDKTNNGKALLANDPHLGLQMPSLWYGVNINADQLQVSGMGVVGLPIVIFGSNADIAWGGTNLMADTQDLFVEKLDNSGEQYRYNNQWLPVQQRTETINVKADFPAWLRPSLEPVVLQVRETRHGPLINKSYGLASEPLSLKWTALTSEDTSYSAFYQLNYASDFNDFRQASSLLVAPAMNLVYADNQGNIGYQAAGHIPVRKTGRGIFPLTAQDSGNGWQGYVAFEDLPTQYNPEKGFIVSANNKPVGEDYPHFLSVDWAPPNRADRISDLLEQGLANQALDFQLMQQMQLDTMDVEAKALTQTMLAQHTADGNAQTKAMEYLQHWDGDMSAESQAATIYRMWTDRLRINVFADEFNSSWGKGATRSIGRQLVNNIEVSQIHEVLVQSKQWWCDDKLTAETETCEDMLDTSLDQALWELRRYGGSDMDDWQWGATQHSWYRHTPFSNLKVFNQFFERRISQPGSASTINVASGKYRLNQGYVQTFGAAFRQVIELNEGRVKQGFINSTGQSGNPVSDHYDDMTQLFHRGELIDINAQQEQPEILVLAPTEGNEMAGKS